MKRKENSAFHPARQNGVEKVCSPKAKACRYRKERAFNTNRSLFLAKQKLSQKKMNAKGLDAEAKYQDVSTGKVYGGDVLMNLGIFQNCDHDMASEMRVFKKI